MEFIKGFEACKLVGYLPTPYDVPTIGWGHTGPEVHVGTQWTVEQAEAALAIDLKRYERCVTDAVTVALTQPEFDACVSLAFNIGIGAFKGSTLVKLLNAGDYAVAAEQFLRWDKQGGKVLAGLTKRREAEKALFESAVV